MVRQLTLLGLLVAMVAGCSGEAPLPVEPPASKEMVQQSSGAWSPEKVAAMKTALSRRRSGEGQGVAVPGTKDK